MLRPKKYRLNVSGDDIMTKIPQDKINMTHNNSLTCSARCHCDCFKSNVKVPKPCNLNHLFKNVQNHKTHTQISATSETYATRLKNNHCHHLKNVISERSNRKLRLDFSKLSQSCHRNNLARFLLLYLTISLALLSLFYTHNDLRVNGYNLDTNIALMKQGPKNSYFGYSIAQHATFDHTSGSVLNQPSTVITTNSSASNISALNNFRSYLIIGAPRADGQPGSFGDGAQHPGAVYKCEFSSSLCSQIELDSSLPLLSPNNRGISSTTTYSSSSTNTNLNSNPNEIISNKLTVPTGQLYSSNMDPTIQRDNQWLGVSVKSQGPNGFAVACAHRYVLKGTDYRWGQGICYSLRPNLTQHNSWEPCLNRPVNRAHEEYGYCQAGTSSDISESNDIVLGAPGPYTWRGTVFTNSLQSGIREDRTWYMAPVLDKEALVDKYSYLGMSVVSGRFLGPKNPLYYASGAPRSNGTGQVLLMTKQFVATTSSRSSRSSDTTFRTDLILSGEQLASSFGYTLAKLDIDGDGQLDLAVGAPFYYSVKTGGTSGGAVYVYTNLSIGKAAKMQKLTGTLESRFGFALTSCGDLNKDGFDDLAIGAPYEEGGGAVYIYSGSSNGVRTTPSQIIRPSDLNMNIQTFGYSLSGGMDMDRNTYPDLAIGAYASDLVIILKARPIIEISTKIDGNITRIDPNRSTCDGGDSKAGLPCFKFNACFELDPSQLVPPGHQSGSQSGDTDNIRLKYKIEAETFTGQKYYRVRFDGAENSDTPNIIEKEILIERPRSTSATLKGSKFKKCHAQKVYLIDKSDIQTSIAFKLSYQLVSNNNEGPYSKSAASRFPDEIAAHTAPLPILNQEEAQRIFSARFLKDCGSNDICESHLEVDGQLHLPREPAVGIGSAPSIATGDVTGNTYYLGDDQLNVTIRVTNKGEPAYDTDLYVTHPQSLSYIGMKSVKTSTGPIECAPVNKTLVKCELGNPMLRGLAELQLKFNSYNIGDDESIISFGLNVTTTSINSPSARTVQTLSASIVRKAELELRGSAEPDHIFYGDSPNSASKADSAIVYQEDIGNAVTHTYVLTNYGPWKTRKVEILVTWPYEIEGGTKDKPKRVLYLTEGPKLYGNGYCEILPGQVNPLKLNQMKRAQDQPIGNTLESRQYRSASVVAPVRYRRSVQPLPEPPAVFDELTEETKAQYIVSVDCEKANSAKCFRFSCYVLDLKPSQSAVIKIHARVWNSTLNENFSYGVAQLNIISRARVRLDDSVDLRQRKDNDFANARTRAHPTHPILPVSDAPWWVITGSVIIGILLLCLLVYILYRAGFFERSKPVYRPADTEDRGFDERFA